MRLGRAVTAWTVLLRARSFDRQAHRALDHPRIDGKDGWPAAVPFLEVRREVAS